MARGIRRTAGTEKKNLFSGKIVLNSVRVHHFISERRARVLFRDFVAANPMLPSPSNRRARRASRDKLREQLSLAPTSFEREARCGMVESGSAPLFFSDIEPELQKDLSSKGKFSIF